MDGGEKNLGELVVACCDGPEMLEFVEKTLNEIAFAIEGEVARQLDARRGLDGMTGMICLIVEGFDEGIGVVGLVGDQSRRIGVLEQGLCASKIVSLAWRKHQLDGIAQGIDERVNFGAQSATRSADRLLAVFLCAPALC